MSYIKIQANQATISPSQNLMDFEVPDYIAGIDLGKSFININYKIETTEPAATSGVVGVHNFIKLFNGIGTFVGDDYTGALFNSCLVRNCQLTASKVGQLESIQRADLINQIKQQYAKTVGDIQGDAHQSIMSLPQHFNYGMDQSRRLVMEGSEVSTERTGVMRVELKDVLGLGESTLNLSMMGSLRLHVEANLNKFTLKEVPLASLQTSPDAGLDDYWQTAEQLAATTSLTQIKLATTADSFIDKKNAPFWVGMKVRFENPNPAANDLVFVDAAIITGISWTDVVAPTAAAGVAQTPALQFVTLTFNEDIIATHPTAVYDVKMYPVAAETLVYTGAELVCKTVMAPPVARGIQYRTYQTVQDFSPATSDFNRTYEVAANAVGGLVCFDTALGSTQFSNSYDPEITQYQLFVNNVGVTDRPVNILSTPPQTKDPLHGIMLEKTLEEMGCMYRNNLDVVPQQLGSVVVEEVAEIAMPSEAEVFGPIAGVNGVLVLPAPYAADGQPKLLNVSVRKQTDVSVDMNLVIFNQIERTVEY